MSYKVLGERVLVKKQALQDKEGGLLVPEEARKSGQLCLKGVVQAIGEDVKYVKEGDVVFFSNYAGQFLQLEDSFDEPDLIVMREDEILVVQVGTYVTEPSDRS